MVIGELLNCKTSRPVCSLVTALMHFQPLCQMLFVKLCHLTAAAAAVHKVSHKPLSSAIRLAHQTVDVVQAQLMLCMLTSDF